MTQTSILVESVAYTPTQVIAIYQADLDAMAAVTAAELALADARAKAKAPAAARMQFDHGFKRAIEGAYGNSPVTMGDFGIVVATPKAPSTAVKAAAVAKAQVTRELRHTMGKKQKADITAASATPTAPSSGAAPDTPSTGGAGSK
jgi:hypothetical protein